MGSLPGPRGGIAPLLHCLQCVYPCRQIRRDGKPVHCVDASREDSSNWMRYVNCPRNLAEANLHPFQYKGALYYRTVSDIPANTELLVWYGNSYGKELGIDAKSFKAAPDNPAALSEYSLWCSREHHTFSSHAACGPRLR